MAEFKPRQFSNTAVNTFIQSAQFDATATSLIVGSNTGYPQTYPFTIRINPGASDEEIIDVISGLGTNSTPWKVERGKDDTIPKAWAQGTLIAHGFSARDFREIQAVLVNAQSLISNAFPVGGIIMWSGTIIPNTIPTKYALCDGKSYDTTTGNQVQDGTYGAVKTPDLRNRFVYGAGGTTSGKTVGQTGGSNAFTPDMMPQHRHTITEDNHDHVVKASGGHGHYIRYRDGFPGPTKSDSSGIVMAYPGTSNIDGSSPNYMTGTDGTHTHDNPAYKHSHGGYTGYVGSATATNENNMPQWLALAFIMRVAS